MGKKIMEDRKIYSLNRIAYLIANKVDMQLYKDNDNKIYAVVDEDIGYLLEKYNTDVQLHAFLGAYRELRQKIKDIQ
jgi:hypothetical protein